MRRRLPDVLGIGWVVVAAIATLGPALVHGASLGTVNQLSLWGLTQQPGVPLHQLQGSDQITLFIPWTDLSWTQVHHGHLPLWNPYSTLGAPLAFNWESASFSIPSLVGYLFPLRLAYSASVLTSVLIGGTGVYVLAWVMRLGVLGCVMAATIYELSGPFMGLLGWPIAWVLAWAGWLFAAALLIVRGRHRLRAIAMFAVVVACAGYAGEPEGLLLLAIALIVFLIILMIFRVPRLGGGPIWRPVRDVVVAGVAGGALFSPLALPGIQVASGSVRNVSGTWIEVIPTNSTARALPVHDLIHVLLQGFDGLPLNTSAFFGDRLFYIDTVAYVGIIALALALLAVVVRRRRPEVVAFGAVALVMAGLVFAQPVVSAVDHVPHLGSVLWNRALLPLAFALAILAGMGTDALVRAGHRRAVTAWAGASFGAAGIVLGALWLFGRGHLSPTDESIRTRSFIWPLLSVVVGLIVVAVIATSHARRSRTTHRVSSPRWSSPTRWAAGALLACETTFLIAAGAPLWASSPTAPSPTAAVVDLKATVGSAVVALGAPDCVGYARLGLQPNVNVLFGIDELVAYDPMTPRSYFSSWEKASGTAPGYPSYETFCPAVTTAALARLYGVSYVLETYGSPGPLGGVFDKTVGDEELYRIPGAAAATVSPLAPGNTLPPKTAPGTPVPVTHPSPSQWHVVTDATTAGVLRLRVTDEPGWRATIDGRALPLERFAGVMLQARVPSGRHVIELSYWPTYFTVGIVLAACSAGGLVGASLWTLRRGRQRRKQLTG